MLPASTRDHRWIPRHTDGEVLQLHGRGGPLMKRRTANLRCGSFLDWFRLPRQSPGANHRTRSSIPAPSAFLVFTTPPGSRDSRVGYRHSLKTCDADCPDRADEADADTARRAGKRSMAIQVRETRPVEGFGCGRRPLQTFRVRAVWPGLQSGEEGRSNGRRLSSRPSRDTERVLAKGEIRFVSHGT